MTYRGTVKGGIVVVEGPATLPEGAIVSISVVEPSDAVMNDPVPTWAEVFKDVIGKAKGLPADSSSQHDRYLYGAPKRECSR